MNIEKISMKKDEEVVIIEIERVEDISLLENKGFRYDGVVKDNIEKTCSFDKLDFLDNLQEFIEKTQCINNIIKTIEYIYLGSINKQKNIKMIEEQYRIFLTHFNAIKYITESLENDMKEKLNRI